MKNDNLLLVSLAKGGESGLFFGLCPKNKPPPPFLRAKQVKIKTFKCQKLSDFFIKQIPKQSPRHSR
jgi:hypothetical protein